MRWLGIITLAAGIALLVSTRRERAALPEWFARLPWGVIALGIGSLLLSRGGTVFSLLSAIFSLIAIAIFGSIVWGLLRRR